MGVIRVPHNDNFTMMANYHLKDKHLSLRAVGLMSKMLSLPDDWDYTVAGLAAICQEGREAVRKVLQELEAAGYLVRDQSRTGGRFSGYDYNLFEKPITQREPEPSPGILGNGDPPSPRIPVPENPVPENPPQLSTKESSTQNIPPKAPQGGKSVPSWKPERFAGLWLYYPRKTSKQAAVKAWDKLRPSDELIAGIGKALRRQKASDDWQRGIGIPYLSTYLNNARWEDEPDTPPDDEPAQTGRKDLVQL